MLGVTHLEGEPADRHPVIRRRDRRRQDVDLLVGEHARHIGEQPVPIQRLDLDGDQEHRRRGRRPLHVDDALGLRLQRGRIRAVGAVHTHPTAAGDEAHDDVSGHRGAALGQLGQHPGRPRHRHADVVAGALPHRHGRRRRPLGQLVGRLVIAPDLGDQPLHDVAGRHMALTDSGVERGHVEIAQLARQRRHRLRIHQALQRKSTAAHLARDRILA